MAQAAQALSGVSESLAAAALPASVTPLDSAMAGAYSAASMAAATPSTPTAATAASAMAAASQAASTSASAQGLAPGMVPGMSGDPRVGTGLQAVDPRVAKLKALGITLADWARLPGTLRSQILQAADEGAPQEYRTLIQRYFQEVARRGSAIPEGRK